MTILEIKSASHKRTVSHDPDKKNPAMLQFMNILSIWFTSASTEKRWAFLPSVKNWVSIVSEVIARDSYAGTRRWPFAHNGKKIKSIKNRNYWDPTLPWRFSWPFTSKQSSQIVINNDTDKNQGQLCVASSVGGTSSFVILYIVAK